ncbi:hypothetical protein [Spirillospora sp. NPDC048824]|uniref:hypothetical protein n=1 Tax=Spirillospora sp. NPDC048824 TaxID=3364526 RepID=UPI00372318BD
MGLDGEQAVDVALLGCQHHPAPEVVDPDGPDPRILGIVDLLKVQGGVCWANFATAASTPLRTFGSSRAYCGMNEFATAS